MANGGGRIVRHRLVDRLFHWITAACVLILLGTAFLPILGLEFAWVLVHWVTGLVLTAAVIFHAVRAALFQDLKSMWIGAADVRDVLSLARFNLRRTREPPPKPGKYSVAQKLIHHLFTLVILTTVVTGLLMLARIDSPLWERNPYWLADSTWGIVYVLHGLGALFTLTMVMVHVYFALRPEKLLFTRAMIVGWVTRNEYRTHHDSTRWQVDE